MFYVILGTKAQLIKVAPVMVELQRREIPFKFIWTGQHKATIAELVDNFSIKKPDYLLDTSTKDITGVFQMVTWLIKNLIHTVLYKDELFSNISPHQNIVLVHGDTISALLGALMGRFAKIPVAHIEAGLRSYDWFNPFPEEITRIVTSLFVDFYFCQDSKAVKNLHAFNGIKIDTKVNTLFDSLQIALRSEKRITVDMPSRKYSVVTIHRFENIFQKERLTQIVNTILKISESVHILFVLHKPTEQNLRKFGLLELLQSSDNIELRPRYDYFKFIKLVHHAEFIISDGGSNQEESYYLGKPCLLLRRTTERYEGLEKNIVVSKYDEKRITGFVKDYKKYKRLPLSAAYSPSRIIVDSLIRF